MKQVIGIFAALVLVPSMQTQAWVGGPWGNDSYQSNGDDGIYEAVGTMVDGTAMYRWAVQNEEAGGDLYSDTGLAAPGATSNVSFGGLVGAYSTHVVWYRGLIYYGRCFGLVNSHMNKVLVTGNATEDGLSQDNEPLNGVALRPGAVTSLNVSTPSGAAAVITSRKGTVNSTFKAKMSKSHPAKRFHGFGSLRFLGDPSFDIVAVNIVNLSNLDSFTGTDTIFVDGPIPVTLSTSDSQFLDEGHKVTMKVFGTRVSTLVND